MDGLNNLELALQRLANKFKSDLQSDLSSKGYKDTGALSNSIKFSFKVEGTNYVLQLSCLEYIKYLDDGKFLRDFMSKKQQEIGEVVQKAIRADIIKAISLN